MYFRNPFENMNDILRHSERREHLHNDPYDPKFYLPHALSQVIAHIKDEIADQQLYDKLIALTNCQDDKDIIFEIGKDEQKHAKLLRQLYHEFTQRTVLPTQINSAISPITLCDGLKEAMMREQKEVETYRKIFFAMEDGVI